MASKNTSPQPVPAGNQDTAVSPQLTTADVLAILAAMQDQLDDLTAAVEAQQATIDRLTARLTRQETSESAGNQ
jgi:hypothetical protein